MARSYLCRAKMLLLLLIPCLYWQSGRDRETKSAKREMEMERGKERVRALGWMLLLPLPLLLLMTLPLPPPLLLLLLSMLLLLLLAAAAAAAMFNFHSLCVFICKVFLSSSCTKMSWGAVFPVHQQHDNNNEDDDNDTFRVCHFPLSFANFTAAENERAMEPTKKFQFEKRKWIWFDAVNASQLTQDVNKQ